jgi:hypothetical protein
LSNVEKRLKDVGQHQKINNLAKILDNVRKAPREAMKR